MNDSNLDRIMQPEMWEAFPCGVVSDSVRKFANNPFPFLPKHSSASHSTRIGRVWLLRAGDTNISRQYERSCPKKQHQGVRISLEWRCCLQTEVLILLGSCDSYGLSSKDRLQMRRLTLYTASGEECGLRMCVSSTVARQILVLPIENMVQGFAVGGGAGCCVFVVRIFGWSQTNLPFIRGRRMGLVRGGLNTDLSIG